MIDKGGNQGINARVKLDVKRGDKVIGKLNITNLEPNVCVCDILSLSEGEKLAVGDSVVLSAESKWDPSKKPVVETIPAPAAPEAAPAKPDAPAEKADDDDDFSSDYDSDEERDEPMPGDNLLEQIFNL